LTDTRRGGAFKNILLSAPGVGKDAVQILPFSQISAKDEFVGVKSSTRDDMLAAHRVPPQLMGAIPEGNGSFGDVEKAARVFAVNELTPVMEAMKHVNDWLGEEVIRFNPYALLETPKYLKVPHCHSRRCGTDLQHHHSRPCRPTCKPQRHIPNQTQPAPFWRAFACPLA
jgi:hypothetical protein